MKYFTLDTDKMDSIRIKIDEVGFSKPFNVTFLKGGKSYESVNLVLIAAQVQVTSLRGKGYEFIGVEAFSLVRTVDYRCCCSISDSDSNGYLYINKNSYSYFGSK